MSTTLLLMVFPVLLFLYLGFAVEVGRFLAGCQPPPYDQERE